MTPIALALVITSTFAHAFWNYLGKRRNPSSAFFLTASLAVIVLLSPLIIVYSRALPHIPPLVWGLLGATGLCQAVYYTGLAGAYRHGDLSVAYPLARALPALLVTLVSVILGLGKPISSIGYAGIFVVVAGCLLIPQPRFGDLNIRRYLNLCCALALLAACGTTGYTIIDSEALRILRTTPALSMSSIEIALLFMLFETAITAVWLGAYVLVTERERAAFREVRAKSWRYAAITGVIITATYGMVLLAMGYVTNVSYLAAFRELSIPLGALLGITLQKEPAPAPKLVGIGVVLVGLLMIGLA